MKYTVERIFGNLKFACAGWSYQNYYDIFKYLVCEMRDKIGHPFIDEPHSHLRFVMNIPLYHEFSIACQMSCKDSSMYSGIRIITDPSLYIGNTQSPDGIVRLIYDEEAVGDYAFRTSIRNREPVFKTKPHIDHVKFNGPATIVFWKDGTKTVVKHDGNGRKDKRLAILYAFIRKIYGEGKPYNNILNEIEEAIK